MVQRAEDRRHLLVQEQVLWGKPLLWPLGLRLCGLGLPPPNRPRIEMKGKWSPAHFLSNKLPQIAAPNNTIFYLMVSVGQESGHGLAGPWLRASPT